MRRYVSFYAGSAHLTLTKDRVKIFLGMMALSLISFGLVVILNIISIATNAAHKGECRNGFEDCTFVATLDCLDGQQCLLHVDCDVCLEM